MKVLYASLLMLSFYFQSFDAFFQHSRKLYAVYEKQKYSNIIYKTRKGQSFNAFLKLQDSMNGDYTKKSTPMRQVEKDLLSKVDSPIIDIQEAPGNSRRIFARIDINAGINPLWNLLTDYDNLQNVIPSLIKNQVLEKYENGAKLLQIGGAKVLPGLTFTAKAVLDVRTYLNPLPETVLAEEPSVICKTTELLEFYKNLPLQRKIYPRPFAMTPQLPHRVITMENVEGEGDFDFYQGVWRLQCQSQPLNIQNSIVNHQDISTSYTNININSNSNGMISMDEGATKTNQENYEMGCMAGPCRLTYAVEIRPKGLLPVRLIEGRIASDLKANLLAIKAFTEKFYTLH